MSIPDPLVPDPFPEPPEPVEPNPDPLEPVEPLVPIDPPEPLVPNDPPEPLVPNDPPEPAIDDRQESRTTPMDTSQLHAAHDEFLEAASQVADAGGVHLAAPAGE